MLWILHVGHAWLGVGFLLRAAALSQPILGSSATHAFTAGAIGCLTIGMMSRVSLGHTGRLIVADRMTGLAFIAMLVAGIVRVLGPLWPAAYLTSLTIAGVSWALAFVLFAVAHARILWLPRWDGAPG
jgi:uncharacterized protein involved in response to NO